MNDREQSELFTKYIGLELKGRIVTRGFSAMQVAEAIGRSPSAFSNWLNGNASIPISVVYDACKVIGVLPPDIVDAAYNRVVSEIAGARIGAKLNGDHVGDENQDV